MKKIEKEFELVANIVERHRNRAIGLANAESLMTYWEIGAFVSSRLKGAQWGSKTVEELGDYLKTRYPKRRGFGKRHIYNMVAFYDTYSSVEFQGISNRLRLDEFVQVPSAQLESGVSHLANEKSDNMAIVQSVTAQFKDGLIVQSPIAQLADIGSDYRPFPLFLSITSFTNHIQVLNHNFSMEERIFYILYSAREHLDSRELSRSIAAQTYEMVMSKEKKMSRRLKAAYPGADFLLKDKVFVDFLHLPEKHNEHKLHAGIRKRMKDFILAIGKDFLYMGDEYALQVGGKRRRLDLLFYHRSLQCLVDVELKAEGFQSEYVGKMDLYLEALDREIKRENENPSVGIILCPEAKCCDVEYTLNRTMSPIMVAEYRRLLIPEEVMKKSLEEYCQFMKKEEGKQ